WLRKSWMASELRPRGFALHLECLEDRRVLQADANVGWANLGPAPQWIAQTDQLNSGRVSALVFGETASGQSALFLGSASGGVWRSTNFSAGTPQWTNTTNAFGLANVDLQTGLGSGLLNVGAMAVDPYDRKTIYVGTGEANYSNAAKLPGSGI